MLKKSYENLKSIYRIQRKNIQKLNYSIFGDKEYKKFMDEIYPKLEQSQFDLSRKLVENGMDPTDMGPTLRVMRGKMEIFREANLPLKTREEELRPHKIIPAAFFFAVALFMVLFTDTRLSIALLTGAMGMV